jgi:hypothetical protein
MNRFLSLIVVSLLAVVSLVVASGCQSIGSEQTFERDKSKLLAASPVSLNIQDNDKIGTLNGTGPGGFINTTATGTEAFYVNSNPRNVTINVLPDGTRQVSIAGGTDVTGKGLKVDPETGLIEVAEFSTIASEGVRASNESLVALQSYWAGLTQAQRDAALAQIETTGQVTESMVPLVLQFLSGL